MKQQSTSLRPTYRHLRRDEPVVAETAPPAAEANLQPLADQGGRQQRSRALFATGLLSVALCITLVLYVEERAVVPREGYTALMAFLLLGLLKNIAETTNQR